MAESEQTDIRERIVRFLASSSERIAEEVTPLDEGVAVRSPSRPRVYSLNFVRIMRPTGYDTILALSERFQRDLTHRLAIVEPEHMFDDLDAAFRQDGWEVDRDLLMALGRDNDRQVNTDAVRELTGEQWLTLIRRWHLGDQPHTAPEILSELDAYNLELGRALGDRYFGIFQDGAPAATAMLRSDGAVAQVEDVYTVPEARSRGYARALVSHAVELARAEDHELIFIVADADGWPRHLYAQVGFEPVGETRAYLRKPPK